MTSGPRRDRFDGVDAWVFDLDHTLYPPRAGVFEQMDDRIAQFIADHEGASLEEAHRLREAYWRRYGATLEGLRRHHGVDPDAFLDYIHDVSLDRLEADPALYAAIDALPGRKLVHTNGSREHARRVIERLGLEGLFERVFAIEDVDYAPKPDALAYQIVQMAAELDARRAAMLEDTVENLRAPHEAGMRTVWKRAPGAAVRGEIETPPYVTKATEDLTAFLRWLAGEAPGRR